MDEICFKNQVKFVCGFANNDFAKIKQTLFKWKIPFWIAFNDRFSPEDYNLGLNKNINLTILMNGLFGDLEKT